MLTTMIPMPRFSTALLALSLAGFALPLEAQSGQVMTEVDSLARVRLVQQNAVPRTIIGQLVHADAERITLRHPEGQSIVPISKVRRLDVSLGSPPIGVRRGALDGFVAGVVIIGTYYVLGSTTECEDCMLDISEVTVKGAVPITVVLTGVGALTGLLPGKERWRSVPLPVKLRSPAQPPPTEQE